MKIIVDTNIIFSAILNTNSRKRLLPQELLLTTEALLQSIDTNDTPFVALATHLGGKLWTGDTQLHKGLLAKGFTNVLSTAGMLLLLEDSERK